MNTENRIRRVIKKNKDVQINLFLGDDPYALGHIVIQPSNDARDISELGEKEWKILSQWIHRVSKAMKIVLSQVLQKEVHKIYLCSFNESKSYPVHFHLVPRYESDTLRGEELLFYRAKAKMIVSPFDRDRIVKEMRRELGFSKEGISMTEAQMREEIRKATHSKEAEEKPVIRTSLVDFTTFSARKILLHGLCMTQGRSAGRVEIYLDEIARMSEEIAKHGSLDFNSVFNIVLDSAVLHELLHAFGAEDEAFCVRVVRWTLEMEEVPEK